jgi:glycosyl transferase family 25
MRIYYINLERRPDRRTRMEALAAARGLDFTRVDAIDAAATDFAQQASILPRHGPTGTMSDNTLACTLSHFKVWETFVNDPDAGDCAVVLEDDVVLAPATGRAIDVLEQCGLGGYALVKLELYDAMTKGAVMGVARSLSDGFALRQSCQILAGSAAYMLTRNTAQHLLAQRGTIAAPVDHFLFYPRKVVGFWGGPYGVLDPPIAVQDAGSPSDIGAQRRVGTQRGQAWRRFRYEAAQAPLILGKLLTGQARVVRMGPVPKDVSAEDPSA